MSLSDYLPTIGVECHVQLKTKTKLFAAVGNDAREAPPNTLISHICVGLPGALPVLNEAAVELSTRAALALNTKPQKFSRFERKHYFYPDLPKGYQITQYENSIIIGGWLEIQVDGKTKKIHIERANLEEDAGKNIHPAGTDYSLVDLNRAGTPLLEIVSRPEINSAAEAKAYARELWLLMKYAGVTDGDLYHGHVRFDVNVSLSKQPGKLGTRSETKNLNSFRSVEAAINYEIKRQAELLEKGQKVVQETRGWDDAKQKTISQRTKEEAEDYRYMPEPDIPPLQLDEMYDERIKKDMPRLPIEWRDLLMRADIDNETAEQLIEIQAEFTGDWFLQMAATNRGKEGKTYANWIINVEMPLRRRHLDKTGEEINISGVDRAEFYYELFRMHNEGMINSNHVEALLKESLVSNTPPGQLAKEKGYLQISDNNTIEKIVAEVLAENPKAAEDVKNGEMKAIGFLVGQVMTKSKGQANPQIAQKLIKEKLGI